MSGQEADKLLPGETGNLRGRPPLVGTDSKIS